MEIYKEIERNLMGKKLTARIHFLDQGMNVLLTGGDKSHIGAVSGRIPGQQPFDLEIPGHKEGILAAEWAGKLSETYQASVWVECGIHYDNLTREDIDIIIHTSREMLEEAVMAMPEISE